MTKIRNDIVLADFKRISEIKKPVFTTNEVSLVLEITETHAKAVLNELKLKGSIIYLKRGLWAKNDEIKPFEVAKSLAMPFESYLSFVSALFYHNMLKEAPNTIFIASLGPSFRVVNPFGEFKAYNLGEQQIFDFEKYEEDGLKIASKEKAIFDLLCLCCRQTPIYLRKYFPLTFSKDFQFNLIEQWITEMGSTSKALRMKNLFEAWREESSLS